MRGLLCAALLAVSALSFSQLTAAERKGLADAMLIGNLSPKDFERPSLRPGDPYCLPLVDRAVTNPLNAVDDVLALHAKAGTLTATGILEAARHDVFGDTLSPDAEQPLNITVPDSVPELLRPAVLDLVTAVLQANAIVRKALSKLTPEEKRTLIDSLPQLAVQEPSIHIGFVKQPQTRAAVILELLDKVDLAALRLASVKLTGAVQAAVPKLKAAGALSLPGVLRLTINGVPVEIGGTEDDVHATSDSMLCIDLGGHNRFAGRYGAGVGYASVLIDLGDSDYDVPDLSVGAGLLGLGVAYASASDDEFKGKTLCFGAGLAGVGVFLKEGGNDTYRATALCQGFGMFGIGLMIDNGRTKNYDATCFAQGAARTQGLGWLVNRARYAQFTSHGIDGRSESQGYSAGFADLPDGLAGGVGLVTQLGGRATYMGERLCQAAATWRALGSVCDTGGGSSFLASSDAQGLGVQTGAAFLFETGKDNSLICKAGGCHASCDADSSAFLLARGGHDLFASGEERTGAGVFLEAGSDNRYLGTPGLGGLFVDLGGSSRYTDGLSDGQAIAEGDRVALAAEGRSDASFAPMLKPGSVPRPTNIQLQAAYTAAVNGSAEDVKHLIEIGLPALDWMLSTKLKGATSPALRLIATMVIAIGPESGRLIVARTTSADDTEASNAFTIATMARLKDAGLNVPAALKRPGVACTAAKAAGDFEVKAVTPDLMTLTVSQDPATAEAAARALAQIGDAAAASTAQILLGSPSRAIRLAAEDCLAKFPGQAIDAAKGLLERTEETPRRTAIELLGKIGTTPALTMVGSLLGDLKPGVRIQAMLALDGRCPAQFRQALLNLRRDPDALVRAVASRIDLGR